MSRPSPRSVGCVAVRLLFFALSTAKADIGTTAHHELPPNCGGYNTILTWDGVVWDQVNVTVLPGYAAGLYSVRLLYYNGAGNVGYTGNINVNVAADGNYTVGYDFEWPALSGAYAYYYSTWVTNGGPNANFSVSGDIMYHAGDVCDGNNIGTTFHGTVNIQIGTPPGAYIKPCDLKSGGNQGCGRGMARYSAHSMLVSLNIEDTPIGYTPPRGPAIDFTITYNQKEPQQPQTFSYSNLGPKWTFNWLSFVTDDPNNASVNASVYVPGGGAEIYSGFNSGSQSYLPDPQSHAILVRTSSTAYEKRFPDGSKQIFNLTDGATVYPRRVFMTQVVDAAGNAATVGYDSNFRITTITDAVGQATIFAYELPNDPLKITRVTDPFGRFATFQYPTGQLTTITDEIGIQSQFTYLNGTDLIDSLTTPYGTTTFVSGQNGTNRWIEMTDPLGGKERVEYRDQAPGIASSDPVAPNAPGITNADLDLANTFYWNKKTMAIAPGDYTKAKTIHWLYNSNGSVSGIASSEKQPLENRVWYTYAGQSDYLHAGSSANPSQIARVLGDGSTQLFQHEYNNIGKTTKTTDPVSRVMTYVYDPNNVDLLEVRQTTGTNNELLRKLTYNSLHEPLTDTDAAGQVTTFTYNTYGQMLTRKNAKNETTTFAYGGSVPDGCLASITSPPFNSVSAVTNFTYDTFKRVRTITDSDGYTVTTDYDNLDRKIKVTYPDTTFELFQYTDNVTGTMTLDLTGSRDRRGLWTYRHYNVNQQMDSITDPANRTTTYGWCTCGALESITDPKGQTTQFNRDIQSRVYQKIFADTTAVNYMFEGQTAPNIPGATSRLQSSTDAKNQRTNYVYFADDTIRQISYTNPSGQPLTPPTPSISYTYDPNYNRVKTMVDGIGTTTYAYNPIAIRPALGAGQLASIDAPLANDTIMFRYDQLGRVTNRSINGAANSDTWAFDTLGRVSWETNKLGTFANTYVGVTSRLSKVAYPGGMTLNYAYFSNAQDKRLQQIKNSNNKNALISQFDYTYDAEGELTTLKKNYAGLSAPQRFYLSYDNADQLLTAPLRNASTNALIKQYTYGYDLAGNRTSELVGAAMTTSTPNNVNEITSQSGALNRTLAYDLNGSVTSDGSIRTFEWDGANRLVAVNYTGTTNRSEFTYDGLSRVVRIVEKSRTKITSTRKFVWCGMEKCEFRDANDAVTLRAYAQGQYAGSTPYFYTRDHLGSTREMLKSNGTVVARYDYDPYGRSTTMTSSMPIDFNFTGLYRHSTSNLDLATFRAYDSDLGRWLSRDPIGEAGGLNLYSYSFNDPINLLDPTGAFPSALVPRYGRWGGPDWSGGWRPSQHGGASGSLAPIDALDAAAMRHDLAYGRWGIQPGDPNSECWKIKGPCARSRCYRKEIADNKLINDSTALYGRFGHYADNYIIGIVWAFNHRE